MDRRNARVHLVHINGELKAKPRLITSESGVYRPGDRVTFQMTPTSWQCGRVNDLPSSDAGGVVMVTLDR